MTRKESDQVIRALRDMLKIARIAMPDTYYESDSRVRRAKRLLETLLEARR